MKDRRIKELVEKYPNLSVDERQELLRRLAIEHAIKEQGRKSPAFRDQLWRADREERIKDVAG